MTAKSSKVDAMRLDWATKRSAFLAETLRDHDLVRAERNDSPDLMSMIRTLGDWNLILRIPIPIAMLSSWTKRMKTGTCQKCLTWRFLFALFFKRIPKLFETVLCLFSGRGGCIWYTLGPCSPFRCLVQNLVY